MFSVCTVENTTPVQCFEVWSSDFFENTAPVQCFRYAQPRSQTQLFGSVFDVWSVLMCGSFHQLLEVNCVTTVGANKQATRSKSTPSAPAWIQILVVVCFKQKNKNKQAKRSSTPSVRKVENAAPVQCFRANSSKTRGAVLAFWAHRFVATYLWYLVLTVS